MKQVSLGAFLLYASFLAWGQSTTGSGPTVLENGATINPQSLNNIQFADQFQGSDVGAKIAKAQIALAGNPGEIWVLTPGPISNPVSLAYNQTLRFGMGQWTLNVPSNSCAITMTSGDGLYGATMGAPSNPTGGTLFTAENSNISAICFVANANTVHIRDIGIDGNARSFFLSPAINTFSGGVQSLYVDNVMCQNWKGSCIALASTSTDNHFYNVSGSGDGDRSRTLGVIHLSGSTNSNQFVNLQFDNFDYPCVVQASSAGGNLFDNVKCDANVNAPSGIIVVLYSGTNTSFAGDKWNNWAFRADVALQGNCIEIDGRQSDLMFSNGYCWDSPGPSGAVNAGVNVNLSGVGGNNIQFVNALFHGFNYGIRDLSAADSNSYVNITFGRNNNNAVFAASQTFLPANGGTSIFPGNVSIGGVLTAAVKNFKIDDPLAPADKYLAHAAVESSEMLTLYSGNVVLNAKGAAVIELPAWFESLNGDFRYQLTAVGTPLPNLHVSEEVRNHHFGVAGGKAGVKVSWMVSSVRQDEFAKAHPLVVEEDKPQGEKGAYASPVGAEHHK